jgi:hypothetical protein
MHGQSLSHTGPKNSGIPPPRPSWRDRLRVNQGKRETAWPGRLPLDEPFPDGLAVTCVDTDVMVRPAIVPSSLRAKVPARP